MAWLLRWQTQWVVPGYQQLNEEERQAFTTAGFVELTILPMGVWLLWATVYYGVVRLGIGDMA